MSSLVSTANSDCVVEAIYLAQADSRMKDGPLNLLIFLYKMRSGFWTRNVSVEAMAAELGVTDKTIGTRLTQLQRLGYIDRRLLGNGRIAAYHLKHLFAVSRQLGFPSDPKNSSAPSTGRNDSEQNPSFSRDYVPRERKRGSVPCSGVIEETRQDEAEFSVISKADFDEILEATPNPSVREPECDSSPTDAIASDEPLETRLLTRCERILGGVYLVSVQDKDPRADCFETETDEFVRCGNLDRGEVRSQLAATIWHHLHDQKPGSRFRWIAERDQEAFLSYYGESRAADRDEGET